MHVSPLILTILDGAATFIGAIRRFGQKPPTAYWPFSPGFAARDHAAHLPMEMPPAWAQKACLRYWATACLSLACWDIFCLDRMLPHAHPPRI